MIGQKWQRANACFAICSTVIGGLLYNFFLVELEISAGGGWLSFQVLLLMYGTITVCLGIVMTWSSASAGLFIALYRVVAMLAISVGTPLGDFSSLNSAASVFACLLGWLCLGEPLTVVRLASVVICFGGAFLVARPEFVFGNGGAVQTNSDTLWLGQITSLLCGCSVAGFFISLRWGRSSSTPLSSFFAIQTQCFVVTLAFVFIRSEPFLTSAVSAPWEGLGALIVIATTSFIFTMLYTFAGKSCPAAVTSVVDVTIRIVTGFLSQWLLQGTPLSPTTVGGGALMLISAVLVPIDSATDFFASRGDVKISTGSVDLGVGSAGSMEKNSVPKVAEDIVADAMVADDEEESIGSFIVSELTSVRSRKTLDCPRHPIPENVGVISDIASVAGGHVVLGCP
eukprot:TRINITY_DN30484_c0_g1_i1.p1 TRINITY_DN30484_c0_g1~~TRINITY_DN30484_c0_g1_i1.p1  ORF type:complete len:398 (-),score=49.49 TRINITY_DN30484_c0_g1_i1:107-1300(-)